MNIEYTSAICAIFIALIAFYLSYGAENNSNRRALIVSSLVIAALAGYCALEGVARQRHISSEKDRLDREWEILLESKIEEVEVELLVPDGILVGSIFQLAKMIEVYFPGIEKLFSTSLASTKRISLYEILSQENISKGGRIGAALIAFHTEKTAEGEPEDVRKIDKKCVTSRKLKESFLNQDVKTREAEESICSITIKLPVVSNDLRLVDVELWENVSVKFDFDELECLMCNTPPLVSIRLHLGQDTPTGRNPIEISPYIHGLERGPFAREKMLQPYVSSLSGKTLLKLAKNHYIETLAYTRPRNFALFMETMFPLYAKLTTRSYRSNLVDVIWSTARYTSEEDWAALVGEEVKEDYQLSVIDQWCGFRPTDMCWTGYALFERW